MDLINSFQGLIKYFWCKVILMIPACFLAFTQSQREIMWAVILIVILDTFLGIWVSIKYKIFSSHHLSRAISKIGTYGLAMLSTWILVAIAPEFTGAMRYTGIFIIITEIFSNFEKLSLLGMKTPTAILARLNKQFMALMYADKKEDKAIISEAILKNRNGKH